MTDNDIVNALECCTNEPMLNCRNCPYEDSCNMGRSDMQKDALDIINRQKAEIERLKEAYAIYEETTGLKQVIDDSIKKFAERLKVELTTGAAVMRVSTLDIIDNLVKEMTEEVQ